MTPANFFITKSVSPNIDAAMLTALKKYEEMGIGQTTWKNLSQLLPE